MEALIFDTHRGTSHDGEGLRTTFFFQGCPLRCKWCHNPEGIPPEPYIKWDARKCIGCHTCVKVCPGKFLEFTEKGLGIDRARCSRCGICAKRCPSKALQISARVWTVDELTAYALKDKHFYDAFNGGVTFSGGEAALHVPFIIEAAKQLHAAGVNTALDTSGYCSPEVFEPVFLSFDCVLFDIKTADNDLHKKFTGTGNEPVLKNLDRLVLKKRNGEYTGELWIRTPIVPNATDTEENILSIAKIVKTRRDTIGRWELCAFNNMCKDKYRSLGLEWEYMETDLLPDIRMRELLQIAEKEIGGGVPVVSTGLTAKERIMIEKDTFG
ncbi:MAG: glycyl-radical enzyme activating protein [Treponema sp.]|jgi:pyruvate formate lyase activating enzyme|nr:glycyl-radical enzyme activating protein [Treponema sp.]